MDLLKKKADKIRKEVVEICAKNGAGHIAPSLSCIDILVALYYDLMEPKDKLVFSKAHGCYGLYAILADLGHIPKKEWESFYAGSSLTGCSERNVEYGIEAGCGSLGHGLPQAVGIAFGAKLQGKKFRTYCVIGDGEMQEGSNWEAVQFAVKHELSNLTVIIDGNGLQAMDFLDNIMTVKYVRNDLQRKFRAFGCYVETCDGHNLEEIISSVKNLIEYRQPQMLVADTIKGYGLYCMENIPKFHFRIPTEEELKEGNRYGG